MDVTTTVLGWEAGGEERDAAAVVSLTEATSVEGCSSAMTPARMDVDVWSALFRGLRLVGCIKHRS